MRQKMNTLSEIRSTQMKQRVVYFLLPPRTRYSPSGTAVGSQKKWTFQVNHIPTFHIWFSQHILQLQRHPWCVVHREKTRPMGSLYHVSSEIPKARKNGNWIPRTMTMQKVYWRDQGRRKRRVKRNYPLNKYMAYYSLVLSRTRIAKKCHVKGGALQELVIVIYC